METAPRQRSCTWPLCCAPCHGPGGECGNSPVNARGDAHLDARIVALLGSLSCNACTAQAVLRSVLPHMDAWYIMDTGSTDGTQDVITRY